MGTTLTGTTPQDTYDSLIKVTDNGPISGTAKYLSDGLGNDSKLALSTTAVGIGTTNPNRILDVNGVIRTQNAGSAGAPSIELGTSPQGNGLFSPTTNTLAFTTNDTERMRITSAGNVGIGTSSPTDAKLQVVGAIQSQSGANYIRFQTDGTNAIFDNSVGDYFFRTSGFTNRLNITSDGYLRLASGTGGIQFGGDTAAANALDDYEEGTFNFVITFGGSDTGVAYSNRLGTYTKIGRQVTCQGWIRLSSKGSATGNAKISGLPFGIAAGAQFYNGGSIGYIGGISFADQISAYSLQNDNGYELVQTTNAGLLSSITDANFTNSSEIMVSFTYFV